MPRKDVGDADFWERKILFVNVKQDVDFLKKKKYVCECQTACWGV